MKLKHTFIILFSVLLFSSCDDEGLSPESLTSNTELVGTWESISSETETSLIGEVIKSGVIQHVQETDFETMVFGSDKKGQHRHYNEDEGEWANDDFTYSRVDNKAEGKIVYTVDAMIGELGMGDGFIDCTWLLKGSSLVVTLEMKMFGTKVVTTYKKKEK